MSRRFDELKVTHQLPSPTGVALAILRLAESDQTTMAEITRVVQTDPALCGRLLKIANSASMGRSRPSTAVGEVVTQLGIRMVRSIALGFSLVSQHGRGACQAFDYTRFWSHSLAMGIAVQAGSRRTGGIAPHEAFTCGLLAQIGRLALACIYPEAYSDILTRLTKGSSTDLREIEAAHFAMDHHELTGALLRDWGLPEECVLAVERFDNPNAANLEAESRTLLLTRLVQLGAQMADVCLAEEGEHPQQMLALLALGAELGIESADMLAMCDRVVHDWREWGVILEVRTHAVPPFAELLERARAAQEKPVPHDDDLAAISTDLRLSIVVIDDDAVAREVLAAQLTKAGHAVQSAADGKEGLRLILEVAPQLVITDSQMPGMDGAALTRSLRQTKLGRQLYVIMLAGSDEEDEAQVEAFAAGADDYLIKPVRPRVLGARLRAYARVVHLQDEIRREREELRRCMAELGITNRKLQKAAALTDVLTGLYNRRFAMDHLELEWAEATRSKAPLACMIIDIDHFKHINDAHGHDIGDRVLQATAEMLRAKMRPSDVICRIGGEEFLVIAAKMDDETALACAERLRASVQTQVIETSDRHLQVTVSIGVAMRTEGMRSSAELLKKADQAVYAAKAAGRNLVRQESDFVAIPTSARST